MTLHAMAGAATLIIAMRLFAALFPTLSIICAASSASSRAWSIRILDSAIRSDQTSCSMIGFPNATRDRPRLHIVSSARSAKPMRRMQ
ncbi:hypothetical protein D9M72_590360 [compost metagenome]